MSITRQNLSVIIVSFKSDHVIYKCIDSIDDQIEIIVIDNSNDIEFKKKIENKYKNVRCILSKENNGMGAGNNLGIKETKKDYGFILNPDVIINTNTIEEIIESAKEINSFGLIAPISEDLQYPNYKLDKTKKQSFDPKNPFKVKSVDGFAMLLNLKELRKLNDFNFFDENFFLYLENEDLCKRIIKNKMDIYIIPKSKINHLGGEAVNPKYSNEIEFSRNWHWMWSKFYYNKKHYGYLIALLKVIKNLFSAKIKFFYYLVTFNDKKKKIYQMRLYGLLNSMIGRKSFHRPKLDN